MAKLIYLTIASLDGYVADKAGNFDWGEPDEEVHTFVNDLDRPVGLHLYGRRMYEVMVAWESLETRDQPSYIEEYAKIWRAADKIVYSTTLNTVSSARTRIERRFEPEAIRHLKATEPQDLAIGGPNLAAHAFRAGLVDECHLFLAPVIVGDGNHAFPSDVRLDLRLQDERPFGNGLVYLHYRVGKSQAA
jgi:dihydrofolate reductase